MNPQLFAAAMAAIGHPLPVQRKFIRVVDQPKHTRNLFGPIEEIAGQKLEVECVNPLGDALCVFTGKMGKNLVDVDHRDIVPTTGKEAA